MSKHVRRELAGFDSLFKYRASFRASNLSFDLQREQEDPTLSRIPMTSSQMTSLLATSGGLQGGGLWSPWTPDHSILICISCRKASGGTFSTQLLPQRDEAGQGWVRIAGCHGKWHTTSVATCGLKNVKEF